MKWSKFQKVLWRNVDVAGWFWVNKHWATERLRRYVESTLRYIAFRDLDASNLQSHNTDAVVKVTQIWGISGETCISETIEVYRRIPKKTCSGCFGQAPVNKFRQGVCPACNARCGELSELCDL